MILHGEREWDERERERRKQFIIKYGCEVNKYNKIK